MNIEIGLDGEPLSDQSIAQIKDIYLGVINHIKYFTKTGTLSIKQTHPEDGLSNRWQVKYQSYTEPEDNYTVESIQIHNALHDLKEAEL